MAYALRYSREFKIDEDAVEWLLNNPEGPVGQLLMELSEQAAAVARAVVPIRQKADRPGTRTTSHPPGFTLGTIRTHLGYDSQGRIYAGVNAAASPSVFLEYPAIQMSRRFPFLTTGLDSLEI